jgi:hypothetical protein
MATDTEATDTAADAAVVADMVDTDTEATATADVADVDMDVAIVDAAVADSSIGYSIGADAAVARPFTFRSGTLCRSYPLRSPNTGWRNASFRGFADYMLTKEFKEGLAELALLSEEYNCVIMCAEALPWRCHRSLIADALTLKRWAVFHIQSKKTATPHTLTPFLKRVGRKIIYPYPKNKAELISIGKSM